MLTIKQSLISADSNGRIGPGSVLEVRLVKKQPIKFYYPADERPLFVKITVGMPKYIAAAKRLLERGIDIPKFRYWEFGVVFESNMSYDLRFMIDFGVVGAGWIELPKKSYSIRKGNEQMMGTVQLEVDVE